MNEQAPDLWTGDDGEQVYLLTRWEDGTMELATRPTEGGTRATWSPPVSLTAVQG